MLIDCGCASVLKATPQVLALNNLFRRSGVSLLQIPSRRRKALHRP